MPDAISSIINSPALQGFRLGNRVYTERQSKGFLTEMNQQAVVIDFFSKSGLVPSRSVGTATNFLHSMFRVKKLNTIKATYFIRENIEDVRRVIEHFKGRRINIGNELLSETGMLQTLIQDRQRQERRDSRDFKEGKIRDTSEQLRKSHKNIKELREDITLTLAQVLLVAKPEHY